MNYLLVPSLACEDNSSIEGKWNPLIGIMLLIGIIIHECRFLISYISNDMIHHVLVLNCHLINYCTESLSNNFYADDLAWWGEVEQLFLVVVIGRGLSLHFTQSHDAKRFVEFHHDV